MCGRYRLISLPGDLEDLFEAIGLPPLKPRYNIAPTQSVPVVRFNAEHQRRQFALVRWGLIPFWAQEASIGNRLINARSETAAEKPAFRSAFRKRRCLIPTDGFYVNGRSRAPRSRNSRFQSTAKMAGRSLSRDSGSCGTVPRNKTSNRVPS
jgi:putative SOS response-associated peptidase YedK